MGQDQLQRPHSDFMDDAIDYLARTLDHIDDGEQNLAIGFTELLDDGGRLLGGTRDNLIGFTQGGWLLSVIDGAKALRTAIEEVFGSEQEVQRCPFGQNAGPRYSAARLPC